MDPASEEINVSFLQVLAILSFEKDNHNALKSPDFLKDILKTHIFKKIDKMIDWSEEASLKKDESKDGKNDKPVNQGKMAVPD